MHKCIFRKNISFTHIGTDTLDTSLFTLKYRFLLVVIFILIYIIYIFMLNMFFLSSYIFLNVLLEQHHIYYRRSRICLIYACVNFTFLHCASLFPHFLRVRDFEKLLSRRFKKCAKTKTVGQTISIYMLETTTLHGRCVK